MFNVLTDGYTGEEFLKPFCPVLFIEKNKTVPLK